MLTNLSPIEKYYNIAKKKNVWSEMAFEPLTRE